MVKLNGARIKCADGYHRGDMIPYFCAMVSIILKGRRVVAVERRHPWVFSGAIARMTAEPEEGDRVVVCDPDGQPLAYGHFQDGSIRVRLFHFGAEAPGPSFWADRLSEARDVRRQLGLGTADTNAYRLVHAEGTVTLDGIALDAVFRYGLGAPQRFDHLRVETPVIGERQVGRTLGEQQLHALRAQAEIGPRRVDRRLAPAVEQRMVHRGI